MPKISLIGPAHRTHLWKGFYERIITNVDFEVVFVTDKKPDFALPDNFKWIYSTVKPAQCFEIAYRESQGEFIIWCGDDLTYSEYSFEQVLDLHKQFDDYRAMIFYRFYEDMHEATKNQTTWDQKYNLTATGLLSRKAIDEAGGLGDKNFVCGLWDCDLIMRIYALGGLSVHCPTARCYEPHLELHKQEANFAPTWKWEDDYFKSLWIDNIGGAGLKRNKPFEPYVETDILTFSQGNKGKWQ
jgi:hypothetical protein